MRQNVYEHLHVQKLRSNQCGYFKEV